MDEMQTQAAMIPYNNAVAIDDLLYLINAFPIPILFVLYIIAFPNAGNSRRIGRWIC